MSHEATLIFWQALTPYLNTMDFSKYLAETPTDGPQARKESKTMTTLQLTDNQQTIPQQLPTVISDVKRAYRGYRILSEAAGWKFYASDCLSDQQVSDLEEWLDELQPTRKAA
jgi:hypothetical protein